MIRPQLTLLLALALSASASAQTPIGPFVGQQSDGFETQGYGGFYPCISARVFNNTADLCTPGASGCNITGGESPVGHQAENSCYEEQRSHHHSSPDINQMTCLLRSKLVRKGCNRQASRIDPFTYPPTSRPRKAL